MRGAVAEWAGLSKQARSLAHPVFIQQVTQASDRHLQYLGSSRLVTVGAMKRANDVVLFKLRQVTFKIDSVLRQVQVGHSSRFILQYPLRQPLRSDAAIGNPGRWSVVVSSPIKSRYSAVLERDCPFDRVLELPHVAWPIVRVQITHGLF